MIFTTDQRRRDRLNLLSLLCAGFASGGLWWLILRFVRWLLILAGVNMSAS